MNTLPRRVSAGISDTYNRFRASETLVMLTMALLVGVAAGYGAVAFRWLIGNAHFPDDALEGALRHSSQTLLASIRRGGRVLIPRRDTRLEVGDVVVALVPED